MPRQNNTSFLIVNGKLSHTELSGGKTKKEKELLDALTDWHNKSGKRNFFIGELKK